MDIPEGNVDTMRRFVYSVLDTLFPPSAEALCVRALCTTDIAKLYTPHIYEGVHVLASFSTIAMKALVHEAKFHNNSRATALLGALLARHFGEIEKATLVIPIPLSRARFHERGYNQVSEIIRAAQQHQPRLCLEEGILRRVKNTAPQTSLPRKERLKNVAGAFSARNRGAHKIKNKHIILIDDVLTTGATIRAAKAALSPHSPASITLLALAH